MDELKYKMEEYLERYKNELAEIRIDITDPFAVAEAKVELQRNIRAKIDVINELYAYCF